MAVLINGNGNEAIYAQQDADWYAALMGGVTMITAVGQQFAYDLLDANTIGVKDGVIITKEGRRIQVDTNVIDTFDIPTGAQGTTNYYIIGYHLVTDETSSQTAETFVQLMENGTDTIPEGSFKEGDDDVYVSLYRVEQNDLTLGTITLLLPTVSDSMQQQISQISADLTANNKQFSASYQNGKYGFEIDGTFYEIGGGAMPTLNYTTPLFESNSSSLTYTATKECYVVGSMSSSTQGNTQISINGIVVIAISTTAGITKGMPLLKLNAGDTISISRSDVNSKFIVYDVIN